MIITCDHVERESHIIVTDKVKIEKHWQFCPICGRDLREKEKEIIYGTQENVGV